MDRLEEFIKANRDDLDRYNPSPENWNEIRKSLSKKHRPLWRWVSVAAMLAVVLSGYLFLTGNHSLFSGHKARLTSDNNEIKQLKETEIYYNNMANTLFKEAKPMLTRNPEIEKELDSDMSHLDSLCTDIKKDLKDNVANQEVIEALIQNYRIKIRLLEDMLTILKENENKPVKKENYEL
ncbi:MAG TPA: hypothetical protein VJ963_12360 [Bacteroidales bacterium]|nr:hypothetical protein [Bacteroidales bacterium]